MVVELLVVYHSPSSLWEGCPGYLRARLKGGLVAVFDAFGPSMRHRNIETDGEHIHYHNIYLSNRRRRCFRTTEML